MVAVTTSDLLGQLSFSCISCAVKDRCPKKFRIVETMLCHRIFTDRFKSMTINTLPAVAFAQQDGVEDYQNFCQVSSFIMSVVVETF